MLPPNPYRIPKPKAGILWRGRLFTSDEKGAFNLVKFDSFSAVLTSSYLWLWRELAIPLLSIKSITLLEEGRTVSIVFHQALIHQDLALHLSAHDFFSRTDKRKLAALFNELNQAWHAACLQSRQPDFQSALKTLSEGARCETCGSAHAALLESGYHYSLGLFPFYWKDGWKPNRPYVCQRHAILTTCWNNFITSLIGFLGFPSIFTGAYHVWKNTRRLQKLFPISPVAALATFLSGLLVPLGVFISLWLWFTSPSL